MNREELADMARRWRVGKGITQKQVAEAIGCVQSEISRIENVKGGTSLDLFIEYIEAMGLELDLKVME